MNIDPALIAMLMKTGLLQAPKQPGLFMGVSGKPIIQGDNATKAKKPIQTIGIRG